MPLIFDSWLTRWRQRMGEERLTALIQASLAVAAKTGALKPSEHTAVVVDTTVQPKNVAHPTDAKLLNRARERLLRLAKKHGVALRQSYGQYLRLPSRPPVAGRAQRCSVTHLCWNSSFNDKNGARGVLHKSIRGAPDQAVVKFGVSHIAYYQQVESSVCDKLGNGGNRVANNNVGRELLSFSQSQGFRPVHGGLANMIGFGSLFNDLVDRCREARHFLNQNHMQRRLVLFRQLNRGRQRAGCTFRAIIGDKNFAKHGCPPGVLDAFGSKGVFSGAVCLGAIAVKLRRRSRQTSVSSTPSAAAPASPIGALRTMAS
jgi:hypothetical protein